MANRYLKALAANHDVLLKTINSMELLLNHVLEVSSGIQDSDEADEALMNAWRASGSDISKLAAKIARAGATAKLLVSRLPKPKKKYRRSKERMAVC